MKNTQIIILAAGHGKRMNNGDVPKVLLTLNNKHLIEYTLDAIKKSGTDNNPVIVVGQKAELVKKTLGNKYNYIFQKDQLGTGHGVAICKDYLENKSQNIMVLYGDMPLITPLTIKKIVALHLKENPVITMATVKVTDFNDWRKTFADFGRIIRDKNGKLVKIVEKKDATPEQQKITEVNPSFFCFDSKWLWENISKLKINNSQKEYYLTDLIALAILQKHPISTVQINAHETLGVNTPEQYEIVKTAAK